MIAPHDSDYGLAFYNDRVKEIIDAAIVAEPFTYVPPIAGHMELVGGNALVFGKITEGYDIIQPDINYKLIYTDVGSVVPSVILDASPVQTGSLIQVDPVGRCKEWEIATAVMAITIPERIYEGSTYFINAVNIIAGTDLSASYVANPGDAIADIKAGLEAAMTLVGMTVVAGSPYNQIYTEEQSRSFCFDPFEVKDLNIMFDYLQLSAYISSYGFTSKFVDLKCGATHGFGIVYKDRAGRRCSVVKTKLMDIYIPFYSETGGPELNEIVSLLFKIKHTPPPWAETYEIVYFGNISMDYFVQIRADNITALGNSRYALNVVDTFEWTQGKNNRWKVPAYAWEAGDRIRLVGTIDEGTGYGEAIGGDFVYDYEIESTGTQYGDTIGGDWLIFQAVEHPTPFEGAENMIVELYRPRKGLGQTVAYGAGMVFDIATNQYGKKYHKGDVDQVFDSDGVLLQEAEVNSTAHDCFKYIRLNYKHASNLIYPFWAESIFPSDWWSNQIIENILTSQGFPFLDDLSQRQTVLHERMRHGGFMITGTRTNNIAHFTYDDFIDLPKKNGDITGLREIGFTLKVIQEYKETSIYINRIQTFNPDGTEQFTLTDKFLSETRPMETDFGCQHPDSIMVNGRNLYYWDNSQGELIRSAPNGQFALSSPQYKMSRWFKDLVEWIRTTGGGDSLVVNIGANNEFEEVWMTFRQGDEIKGIVFSEKKGRFITEIDQITESYLHLGNFFAHLYRQRLWIMNMDEGQGYLSWSGTDTYAEIEIVSNVLPEKNKVFTAIGVIADHLLESLARFVCIPIEASAAGELMESNVPVFDHREGIYFGKIMKDENTKGTFASIFARKLNGREMRGRFCFVKLRTSEHNEKVKIDSITVFSTPSERNI